MICYTIDMCIKNNRYLMGWFKMKNKVLYVASIVVLIAGCNSGSNTIIYPTTPTNLVGINNNYECLPSGYPGYSDVKGLKIAYGSDCKVANADSTIRPSLESMAIAISDSFGSRYCSGTPLSYDPSTGIGYVLTAAHCVVNSIKSINTQITSSNITLPSNKKYVNQSLNAFLGISGTIKAVYVPNQYCESSSIKIEYKNGKTYYVCSNLAAQNGDVALLQVKFNNGVKLSNDVKLADTGLDLPYPSYIMALGYGITDKNSNNTDLFYITYEYFATNSYMGISSSSTIMNGYSKNNAFYNIICGGDSGGGDFYWDDNSNKWQLVGVHSFGSAECGKASPVYSGAMDVSADVRPFANKLNILKAANTNIETEGCHSDLAAQNGFICAEPN